MDIGRRREGWVTRREKARIPKESGPFHSSGWFPKVHDLRRPRDQAHRWHRRRCRPSAAASQPIVAVGLASHRPERRGASFGLYPILMGGAMHARGPSVESRTDARVRGQGRRRRARPGTTGGCVADGAVPTELEPTDTHIDLTAQPPRRPGEPGPRSDPWPRHTNCALMEFVAGLYNAADVCTTAFHPGPYLRIDGADYVIAG